MKHNNEKILRSNMQMKRQYEWRCTRTDGENIRVSNSSVIYGFQFADVSEIGLINAELETEWK